MAIKVGDAILFIGADTKGLTKGLSVVKSALGSLGASSRAAGAILTVGGGALTTAFGIATKMAGEFEQAITNAAVVTGKVGQELAQAKEAIAGLASTLGETTVSSARQAADALGILARKGFDVAQFSVKEMQPFLDLAAATLSDLTFVTDIASSTMRAFGIANKDVTRISDVFVKATNTSALNMQTLGEAMKFVAPLASSAGISLETVTAVLGKLANKGTNASIAGTGLRRVIAELIGPGNVFVEVLKRLNLTTADISLETNDLIEVLDKLKRAGFTTADAMTVFGQRAGPIIEQVAELGKNVGAASKATKTFRSNLSKTSSDAIGAIDGLKRFRSSLLNLKDVAKTTAEEQLNTLRGKFVLLKSAAEGFMIAIGQKLVPILTIFAEKAALAIQRLTKWIKENDTLTDTVIRWVASMGIMATAIGAILVMLPAVIKSFLFAIPVFLGLIPVFRTIAGAITEMMAAPEQFFESIFRSAEEFFKDYVNTIGAFVDDNVQAWSDWRENLTATIQLWEAEFLLRIAQVELAWVNLMIAVDDFRRSVLGGLIEATIEWANENKGVAGSFILIAISVNLLSKVLKGAFVLSIATSRAAFLLFTNRIGLALAVGGAFYKLGTWIDKVSRNKALGDWFDRLADRFVKLITPISDATRQAAKFARKLNTGVLVAVRLLAVAVERLAKALSAVINLLPQLGGVQALLDRGGGPGAPVPFELRANGGFTQGATLVGEQGPELIRPPSGSRVFSNAESRAMMGGESNVEINININGANISNSEEMARVVGNAILQLQNDRQLSFGALA